MDTSERELKTQTTCMMLIAAVLVGVALYWLRPVLLPFVLALFFASGIAPLLSLLEKRLMVPRMVAVAITLAMAMVVMLLLWWLVWVSVQSLAGNIDSYRARFDQLMTKAASLFPIESDSESIESPTDLDEVSTDRQEVRESVADANQQLATYVGQNVRKWLLQLSGALTELLSSTIMVLIFLVFLLLGGTSATLPREGVWAQIESKIRNYIVTKTVISVFTAGAFGLVLWIFGVPLAMVFGLLAFLFNFIPNIGPVIACLLPIPLIVLDANMSTGSMVTVIILSSSIQFISGNVVEPKIMGESFQLHPVAILLTLMLWGMIWGIVGMFLATPITAVIKILFERFDHTKPIAYLLEGRFDRLS